jgi:hypothetical protein
MMKLKSIFAIPPRNSDGGSGAGGVSPAASGAAGAGGPTPPGAPTPPAAGSQPGGAPSQPGGAPSWSRPSWVGERIQGASPEEVLRNLEPEFRGLREQVSKIPKAGDRPEAYAWSPSEKTKAYAGDLAKDAVYAQAQKAAHAAGIPVEQFSGFLESLYAGLGDAKFFDGRHDPAKEVATYLGRQGDPQELALAIKPTYDRLGLFLDGFSSQHGLDPQSRAELGGLLTTAAGLKALDAMSKALGQGVAIGGQGGGSAGFTRSQLQEMMRDPRADISSPQFDPAFRDKIDQGYKSLT